MHYYHIISVQAETKEEAESATALALDPYGDGQVWDWYEIGGRWDGVLGATGATEETTVEGTNALSYADNPELFVKTLDDIEAAHSGRVKEILAELNGDYIRTEDVGPSMLGLPIPDRAATALRISKHNRAMSLAFKKILSMKTVPDGPLDGEAFGVAAMMVYKLRQLCDFLAGQYTSNSHFYDYANYSTHTSYLRGRIEEGGTSEWLVVVDLHN
jgi:hypothetical protein